MAFGLDSQPRLGSLFEQQAEGSPDVSAVSGWLSGSTALADDPVAQWIAAQRAGNSCCSRKGHPNCTCEWLVL